MSGVRMEGACQMITHLAHIPIFNRSVYFVGHCSADDAEDAVYRLHTESAPLLSLTIQQTEVSVIATVMFLSG